jgi:hypothetical protein
VLTSTNEEPKSVRKEVDLAEDRLWKDVVVEEMESLHKNEMWNLVELPSGRNLLSRKWVFNKNMNAIGQVDKFKARLVAKGYSQFKGVDFSDIFSPIAKLTSIKVLMSLAIEFDIKIEKMDVKTMFLHGDLEEEIYIKQLEGFVIKGKKELLCKLKTSLYSLKQLLRMWYQNFDTYILSLGSVRSNVDHCVYLKEEGIHFIYSVLYVDDMLLVRSNMDTIKEVKKRLFSKFDMKDLGATNFILGMEIKRDREARKF